MPDPTTPHDPPQAGVLVADRYRLIEPLARGGVAWVWRAHDQTLDRPVAIKIVRADADPVLSARLRAEAQTAAKVRHTGVISVYDTGSHDGVPFIAMELVEGETLRAGLLRDGRMDAAIATTLTHHVAAALDAMHRAGLVHGDLKPENIMVTPEGMPKITDLGLARSAWQQGADDDEHLYGTPGYLAPERRHGGRGDARSDIYALGAVLFELLTGLPPASGDLPWAPLVDASVPDELAAVVKRATEHDPSMRYSSASAMALQLAGVSPAEVRETSMLDPTERETMALRPPAQAAPVEAPANRDPQRRRVIIGVVLAAFLAWLFAFGPVNRTSVPAVTGIPQTVAEQRLDEARLTATIDLVYNRDMAAGIVIAQDPLADASMRRGRAVTLTVSLGPRLALVPDVQGLQPADARAELESEGFTDIAETTGFSSVVAVGEVFKTVPPIGERVDAEAPIVIHVSKGPELVAIPVVTKLSEREARLRLVDAGFKVAVTRAASRTVDEGDAIRTNPVAGKKANRGSTITLIISSGQPLAAVPDLRCMTERQAEDALESRGLKSDTNGKGKRVVDQDPAPGAKIREGETVEMFMGFGAFCNGTND